MIVIMRLACATEKLTSEAAKRMEKAMENATQELGAALENMGEDLQDK